MKKTQFFLIVYLCTISFGIYSQNEPVETYNRLFHSVDTSHNQLINGIVESGSYTIIYGNAYTDTTYRFVISNTFQNIDSITWQLELGSIDTNYFGYDLISAGNNEFVATGSKYYTDSTGTIFKPFFIKINSDGDIIWEYSYILNENPEISSVGKKILKTHDGGYLIIGGAGIMGLLIKTDSIGNKLWGKTIGFNTTTNYVYLNSGLVLPDSGFLIGGSSSNGHDYYYGTANIYRFDKSGNLLWTKYLGGPYKDRGTVLSYSNDSNIIGAYELTTKIAWWGDRRENKIAIFKLDSTYNILWEKKYGEADKIYWVTSIDQMKNNRLLISGQGIYLDMGWIFHTLDNGDSLSLKYFKPTDVSYEMFGLNNCIITSDQAIIASGEARKLDNYTPSKGWIVKTDSYGCLENIGIIYQPTDKSVKLGDTLILEINVSCNIPVTYQWFKGDSEIEFTVDSLLILENIKSSDEDIYFCQVSNNCETITTDTFSIEILYDNIYEKSLRQKLFTLAPNPARNIIFLKPLITINENISITITTSTGKEVKEVSLSRIQKNEDVIIDVESLVPNFYIVKIVYSGGFSVTKFLKI
ncbi:MAG: immunoglobulin domain-containing protein [Bacteroidetes bacterium]|nr:immunoglobulin domain-containing protein [Bacteroidota bacterium]